MKEIFEFLGSDGFLITIELLLVFLVIDIFIIGLGGGK